MGLLSATFNIAIKEWGWLSRNPCSGVRKPPRSKARDRRISEQEVDAIIKSTGLNIKTISGRLGWVFLFAIETAMRAGEIASLTWDNIKFEQNYAHLPETKNGTSRDVPLTSAAIMILMILANGPTASCFNLSSRQIDANFRKYKKRCKINDLHFHDTRHEGITRLSKKPHLLALARAVGHTNLKQLQPYYNESASDIVKLLM